MLDELFAVKVAEHVQVDFGIVEFEHDSRLTELFLRKLLLFLLLTIVSDVVRPIQVLMRIQVVVEEEGVHFFESFPRLDLLLVWLSLRVM